MAGTRAGWLEFSHNSQPVWLQGETTEPGKGFWSRFKHSTMDESSPYRTFKGCNLLACILTTIIIILFFPSVSSITTSTAMMALVWKNNSSTRVVRLNLYNSRKYKRSSTFQQPPWTHSRTVISKMYQLSRCYAMACNAMQLFCLCLRRSKFVSAIMGSIWCWSSTRHSDRAAHLCQHCIDHQPQNRHNCIISASSSTPEATCECTLYGTLCWICKRVEGNLSNLFSCQNLTFPSHARQVGGRDWTQQHAALRAREISTILCESTNKHPDQISRIGASKHGDISWSNLIRIPNGPVVSEHLESLRHERYMYSMHITQ